MFLELHLYTCTLYTLFLSATQISEERKCVYCIFGKGGGVTTLVRDTATTYALL